MPKYSRKYPTNVLIQISITRIQTCYSQRKARSWLVLTYNKDISILENLAPFLPLCSSDINTPQVEEYTINILDESTQKTYYL